MSPFFYLHSICTALSIDGPLPRRQALKKTDVNYVLSHKDAGETVQTTRGYMAFRPVMLWAPIGDCVLGETAEVTELEI